MSNLEELFKDRYTAENERYAKISEGFEKVVIVHPWNTQRGGGDRRNFNNRGRGGFRGSWRGGNNNQGWRGGNGGGGGDRRRHYNDRN